MNKEILFMLRDMVSAVFDHWEYVVMAAIVLMWAIFKLEWEDKVAALISGMWSLAKKAVVVGYIAVLWFGTVFMAVEITQQIKFNAATEDVVFLNYNNDDPELIADACRRALLNNGFLLYKTEYPARSLKAQAICAYENTRESIENSNFVGQ